MGGIKEVTNDDILPAVLKYAIKDLDKKLENKISDDLVWRGRVEAKLDTIIKSFNDHLVTEAKTETRTDERLKSVEGRITGAFTWLGLLSIAIIGGLVNFILGFFRNG